jgi:hypothetical protein
MKTAILAALALGSVATVAFASAGPGASPLSLTEAIKGIEAKGYTVLEIDREGIWFEVDALTVGGTRVELIVDAATAGILSETADD